MMLTKTSSARSHGWLDQDPPLVASTPSWQWGVDLSRELGRVYSTVVQLTCQGTLWCGTCCNRELYSEGQTVFRSTFLGIPATMS